MRARRKAAAVEISARELLDAGVERLQGELAREQPEVRAALLEAAGDTYRAIGEFDKSSALLEEAVAIRKERESEDPVAYGRALLREALLRRDEGKYQQAANLARQALAVFDAADINGLPSAAEGLTETRVELAEILRRDSQLDEAAKLTSAAVADLEQRARGTEGHIAALFMLGRVHQARGDLKAAEPLLRRAYDLQTKLTGEFSVDTVNVRNGLADFLVVRGNTDEAESLFRRNVDAVRQIYGDKDATLGIAWNNLANALSDIPARYGEAEKAYLEAIRILTVALGPEHPEVSNSYNNLGALYNKTDKPQKAADAYRLALKQRMVTIGPDHPSTTASRMGLGVALNKLGERAEAEAMLRDAKAAFAKSLGPQHWRTANAQYQLGIVLRDRGKHAEALAEVSAGHTILLAELGPDHPRTVAAAQVLAELQGDRQAGLRTAP